MASSPAAMPAPGPSRKSSSPRRAAATPKRSPRVKSAMAIRMIGSSTMSFKPLSRRSARRTVSGSPGRLNRPRSITGSVDASAAPIIAAAAGEKSRISHAARAMSAAESKVPGPTTRNASSRWRRISAMLRLTASVKSTSARLMVATTLRIGASRETSSSCRPAGPSMAPRARKTPTCGISLRSMKPDKSAATMMTAPTSASVMMKNCGLKKSMGVGFYYTSARGCQSTIALARAGDSAELLPHRRLAPGAPQRLARPGDHFAIGPARRHHRIDVLVAGDRHVDKTRPGTAQYLGKGFGRIGGLPQIERAQAEAARDGGEVRAFCETAGVVASAVKELLLLAHHAQVRVVEQNNFHLGVFFRSRGEFLDIHQQAAVAGETDNRPLGARERRADRRRQAEAHGAETAGGEPLARLFERIGLRRPHLVLPHVGGDDGV